MPDTHLPDEWIDQIPTHPSAFKARVVSVAVIMLVVFGAWVKDFTPVDTTTVTAELADEALDAAEAAAEKSSKEGAEPGAQASPEDATVEAEGEPDEEAEAVVEIPLRAGPLGLIWECGPGAFQRALARNADAAILLEEEGLSIGVFACFTAFGGLGLLFAALGVLSLIRCRLTYHLLKIALLLIFPVVLGYLLLVWNALFAVSAAELQFMGVGVDRAETLKMWWKLCWPAMAMATYVGWVRVMMNCQSVYRVFASRQLDAEPMPGDHTLEDLRTHGRDPRARKSLYGSVFTHVFILVIIPWLMGLGGCVEAYRVPKGSGQPAVAVKVQVKKKKKKKKTLSLRPNSAIIFEIPDLDDTEVDQILEEQTQLTYEASNAKTGKLGKGNGKKGGWPEGMDKYKIRFIRLDHGGAGWDDGMNKSEADINFLRAFAKATGFTKIASKGESHSIRLLKKYPDDGFPPFVYLTGNSDMGRISSADQKILRDYCLKGGMLIADAGSARFHRSFTHFVRQTFPDKPLLDIADDDMIYQQPFGFPNGAPAFWHHGGRRAMGLKHEGRWMLFYHPGDMNDAWKSPAYTDVKPEMRDAAMHLGVNLVYYAFNHWDDAVAKARK
ncbi:MAG: hypothetical protein ACI8W8_003625 [Rhodothermales bacterium]|jgi:hypothetical protein